VHIDPVTRLPARLPEVFHRGFAESAGEHRPRTSLRHPASPPEDAERLSWRFTDADIDIAGHVNNTMYWRLAEELLPAIAGPVTAEAEYRAGASTGDATVRRAGGMIWVLGADDETAATLALTDLED
jgi:acyl-ACP thioesterase